MLIFSSQRELVGMLDWFEHHEDIPFPEPAHVEFFGSMLAAQNTATIHFDNKFTITFVNFPVLHDLLRCDINEASRTRVLRTIKTALIDKKVTVEGADFQNLPNSVKAKLSTFTGQPHNG